MKVRLLENVVAGDGHVFPIGTEARILNQVSSMGDDAYFLGFDRDGSTWTEWVEKDRVKQIGDLTEPRIKAAVGELLGQMKSHMDAEEAAYPQVIVQVDPETDHIVVYGPYEEKADALIAMHALSTDINNPRNNDGAKVIFGIAAMHPAEEITE